MDSNKKEIQAILDEDLKGFLEEIGEIERLEESQVSCRYCGDTIRIETIGAIIPTEEGDFLYVCHSTECVENYYK